MTSVFIVTPIRKIINGLVLFWKLRLWIFIACSLFAMIIFFGFSSKTLNHPELFLQGMKAQNASLMCEQNSPNRMQIIKIFSRGENCEKLVQSVLSSPQQDNLFDYKKLISYKDDKLNVIIYVTYSHPKSSPNEVTELLFVFEVDEDGKIEDIT